MITHNASENRCVICYDNLGDTNAHTPVNLRCGHVFGRSCITLWSEQKKQCPICRQEFSDRELAMPQSLLNRVLSKVTFNALITGYFAFTKYLDNPQELMTNTVLVYKSLSSLAIVSLATNVILWRLRGRNYSLACRVRESMDFHFSIALNVTVGIIGGVAGAAFFKRVS